MEKPTMSQRMASFGKFIYNSETKQVLGRGGRSWAEIGFFYLIYYICLAGFFAATLAVFYETIDDNSPKLQGSASLLKGNPGMGFQPMLDIDTTLIRAQKGEEDNLRKNLEKVLTPYANSTGGVNCSEEEDFRRDATTPCQVDYEALTEGCNNGNYYGYKNGEPCILLKLNKIYGWEPELWTKEEVQDADEVPDEIKAKYEPDRIWIYCHGENPADRDYLRFANITYYPDQGFPLAYYPFANQEGYLSPLVFVRFNNLLPNFAFMIECKALAKNIKVDREEKEGSVHFELLVY